MYRKAGFILTMLGAVFCAVLEKVCRNLCKCVNPASSISVQSVTIVYVYSDDLK